MKQDLSNLKEISGNRERELAKAKNENSVLLQKNEELNQKSDFLVKINEDLEKNQEIKRKEIIGLTHRNERIEMMQNEIYKNKKNFELITQKDQDLQQKYIELQRRNEDLENIQSDFYKSISKG